MTIKQSDLEIATLGPARIDSPIHRLLNMQSCETPFVMEWERIVFDPKLPRGGQNPDAASVLSAEPAGPRCSIYFEPAKTRAAVVSCGGLCPGINDVIRGIVMTLYYRYGVTQIDGIPYGYQGFIEDFGHKVVSLTPENVSDIHKKGGTILGSSRGQQNTVRIVDYLKDRKINLLFVIGGDGTLRGALAVSEEAERQKLELSVVGIPKTIDNDILHIDQSFGFETAFSEAVKAINAAHLEAMGAPYGVGLVKLMGRHSGFIACFAALAMNDVNFVLIPEVPFDLEGESGFLSVLAGRLQSRKHAVIVAAEGAGQELIEPTSLETDASGNLRLKDIGLFLADRIKTYFKSRNRELNLKYIDPSYTIRSIPATPQDSVYCLQLAAHAVHAAMSGRTRVVVARRNGHYVHLPMRLIAFGRKLVDPKGVLWLSVLEATGQPVEFKNRSTAAT